jgi:hypothetical protein
MTKPPAPGIEGKARDQDEEGDFHQRPPDIPRKG